MKGALTREQVVVGLDELRAALLDAAVLAKGGMSELVLQEAIAALSSPCACRNREVIAFGSLVDESGVWHLNLGWRDGGKTCSHLKGLLVERDSFRVLIFADEEEER